MLSYVTWNLLDVKQNISQYKSTTKKGTSAVATKNKLGP